MNERTQPDEKLNLSAQFSWERLLAFVVLFAIVFAGIRLILEAPNDACAMWAAGEVLIEYMSANAATWPDSWGTLSKFECSSGSNLSRVGPSAKMRSRIHIDFNYDPKSAMSVVRPSDKFLRLLQAACSNALDS